MKKLSLKHLKPVKKLRPRPSNVFTSAEYAEERGISRDKALKDIAALIEDKRVKKYTIPVQLLDASGRIQSTVGWEVIDAG